MSSRKAVEKLVGRMYKQYQKSNGNLPDGKVVRCIEQKAVKVATRVDKKKRIF